MFILKIDKIMIIVLICVDEIIVTESHNVLVNGLISSLDKVFALKGLR